ncbi:MAG TPA: hypothetical protein VMF30_03815, partial [Pirellulales bacterium]|nr:hypothetical protein [Pirellulales bacterium]
MRRPWQTISISLAATALFAAAVQADSPWDRLAAKVPRDANAVVLMNIEKLLASPIAQRDGWAGKLERAFEAGLNALPPSATLVLEAADLDFETWQPRFELALLALDRDVSLANLARQSHGRTDTVVKLEAVVLPQDAYIVALEHRLVAGLSPANRQATVRWLREIDGREQSQLSPYLAAAVREAGHIDIVEALDMRDAVPADVIRAVVGNSQAVAAAKPAPDVEKLVGLLSMLEGVTFEVVFKEQAHARFLVDFQQDAEPLAAIGKPLLLEILRSHGAWIADFDGWKASIERQRFVLTGTLTPTGLRKILSLIEAPIATFTAPGQPVANSGSSSAAATASHAYFRAVQTVLADARAEAKDSVTLGQNAAWLDRWARKIERLPILDVDPELLNYGDFV